MTATSKHYPGEPIGLPNWNGDDTLERAYPTWPSPRRNAPAGPTETPRAIAPARADQLALKAVRARALTDPLGAKGFRAGTRDRVAREWHARRMVFAASLATFAACFGIIVNSAHTGSADPVDPAPAAAAVLDNTPTSRATATATSTSTAETAKQAAAVGAKALTTKKSTATTAPTETPTDVPPATDTPTAEPTATEIPRSHVRSHSSS